MPGVDLYHHYTRHFLRNFGFITRPAMHPKAFGACFIILCIYFGNTNCSQKYYAIETLEIFPEVKGKIIYSGEIQAEKIPAIVLKDRVKDWINQKDSVRGQAKEIQVVESGDRIAIQVKKRLFMDIPHRTFVRNTDPSATYFEYKLNLTIADGAIKYELNSVKAFYYQLLGSNRTINDWHDIVEDAITPATTFGPGRYDPLPVSNYLDRGYATLMGRDNMVNFYIEIDQNIKVVLASLRKSVAETGSSNY